MIILSNAGPTSFDPNFFSSFANFEEEGSGVHSFDSLIF